MKQCPICGVRFDERATRCPIDGAELVAVPDPLVGRVVQERYLIEALIGSGGMASVYRGRHRLIDRQVALKFLKPKQAKDATARARFLREARAVNRVQHEHIVDVSDFGETDDGLVYMVMEHLDGRTLTTEITRGPLSLARTCHIGLQLSQALARAHEHGVVHRDVKPANIFLIQRGDDADFVKLLDFGLARGTDDVALTSSNLLFGTPEYMAPEQVRGGPVGAKADLYALGCVLFEMVAGRLPFEGAPTELIYRHLYDLPPRPSQLRPELPLDLERLILRLLSKSDQQRPANAQEVASALMQLGASLAAPPVAVASRPRLASGVAAAARSVAEDDDDLDSALSQLEGHIAQRYPHAAPPPALARGLRTVSHLVSEAQELKQGLAGLEAEAGSDTGRATQLRIGAAIESLEIDATHAAHALEALRSEREYASAQLREAAAKLMAAWTAFDGARANRTAAAPMDAELIEHLRDWAHAQREKQELDERFRAHQAVRADLQLQITQLRHRLLDIDAALQPTVAKAAELQLQLSVKLAAIRAEAERVTEQLTRQSHSA